MPGSYRRRLVRRRLYTDDDLSVLSFRRVVVLNGIDFGTLRGDLGAVLTITASVLARLERVRLESMPRMADFARVLAALDQTTRGQAGALPRYLGQADSLAVPSQTLTRS